ncbi:tether containing UBX domain for GLUT4 [Strongylocentrotus purpuratus]|uniref:UBX domain-containing protein n=1 Tax=Strongylocentrotus purpuratus TaxID=7668 RepID=A0A7M7P6K1_STRPU|nr:tether containing UBX domain for GLUT4 [Strongylocentrotus purpuratus]
MATSDHGSSGYYPPFISSFVVLYRPSLTCPSSSSSGTAVHPVCIYMREEIIGEEWLKATTLKGLGLIGGRAIIRLLHRDVELPPPPKKTQPEAKSEVPAAPTPTPAAPPNQMDSSSTTPQSSATLGHSTDAFRGAPAADSDSLPKIKSKPAPPVQVTENTPATNELAQPAGSSEAAMDCATSDNRDESAMEVDAIEMKSENTNYRAQECPQNASDSSHLEERTVAQETSVRRKEKQIPSTSKGGGEIPKEEKTEKVVKDIEKNERISLDEYARRRIQSLLEKEEEMVKSMQEAMQESMSQKSQGALNRQPRTTKPKAPVHAFADFKFPEPKHTDATDEGKGKEKQDISSKPCDRNQLVFSPDQDPFTLHGSSDVPDEFFDLTVDDVRRMLSNLRHQSADSERNLTTKAMRDAQDQKKMKKYDKVVVRVHFPDRIILQGFFRPQEKVEAVKEFVRSNLAEKDQQFYLYTTPPKTILKDTTQTLFKAKLFPAAVVYFGSQVQKDHYLHEEALGDLASLLQAESIVAKNMNTGIARSISSENKSNASSSGSGASSSSIEDRPSTSCDPGSGQGSTSSQQKRQASPSNTAMGSTKVPKWFKIGKR